MKELVNPSIASVLRLCLSHALELAFFKETVIGGKTRKVWSQASHVEQVAAELQLAHTDIHIHKCKIP